MTSTPFLNLPILASAQAQKHVTMNEALCALDALAHLAVKSRVSSSPPASPFEAERYLVPQTGAGSFAQQSNKIAVFLAGHWQFFDPQAGWLVWVKDEGTYLIYDGALWRELSSLSDLVSASELSEGSLQSLGVGAAPSPDQKLIVSSNNTAITHDPSGSGSALLRVNKAASGNEAGVALLSNWVTKALLGLLGDDGVSLKVSADGSTFREAMRIDGVTGAVSFQQNETVLSRSENGAESRWVTVEEELNPLGGSFSSSIVLPARSVVFAVTTRVLQTITGASSWSYGTAAEPQKFANGLGGAQGSVNDGLASAMTVYSDTPIQFTANGGAFSGGKIRLALHYFKPAAPTS
ncbi:DUF2793 domain-containing protein [Rhodobacteraceae bacterium RKSG542]|uniref:DUF2793 domain-containing protein n=1 Tax=Pseudovibrio flavus TaxID=2529854 RepID=UPI0012BB90F9|nr:DUF2793 domain-containing protein [Pseudovibrio flavus]MTI16708.1 DUF2793 domain-containing protein [Pseudovibrio flavus]